MTLLKRIDMRNSNYIILISCVLGILLIAAFFVYTSQFPYIGDEVTNISGSWYLGDTLDVNSTPASIPGAMQGAVINTPWVISKALTLQDEGMSIMFVADYAKVTASVGGEEIGRWGL